MRKRLTWKLLVCWESCKRRSLASLQTVSRRSLTSLETLKSSLTMPQKKWTKRIPWSIWNSLMSSLRSWSTERSVYSTLVVMSTIKHFLKWVRSTVSASPSRSHSPCSSRLVSRRFFHHKTKMALQWLCVEKLCKLNFIFKQRQRNSNFELLLAETFGLAFHGWGILFIELREHIWLIT